MLRSVLALALVACGPPPTPPVGPTGPAGPTPGGAPASGLRAGPPIASPGEHMHYKLSLQGLELAAYDLAVGEPTDAGAAGGARALPVTSHAKVTGLAAFLAAIDDHFTSWLDPATGRSLRFEVAEYATGSRTDIEHVVVDHAGRTGAAIPVSFHLNAAPAVAEPQQASLPESWDVNALLIALRGWEAPAGTRLTLEVFRSRFLWHVELTLRGKERLATDLGELPAVRLEGRTYKLDKAGARAAGSDERAFTIWISDDAGRVPLEIKAVTDYGDLRMRIDDYQPGRDAG